MQLLIYQKKKKKCAWSFLKAQNDESQKEGMGETTDCTGRIRGSEKGSQGEWDTHPKERVCLAWGKLIPWAGLL